MNTCLLLIALLAGPQAAPAARKPAEATASDSTVHVDLSIDVTKSGKAVWWEFTPSVSVDLSDRWTVEGGVPIFVVNGDLSSDGLSHAGIGDVYGSLSCDLSGDEVTASSTFSLAAPTGSVTEGLGFGRVTWDWTNHLEQTFGRITPFADLGFSNAFDFTYRVNRTRAGGVIGAPQALLGDQFNGEAGLEVAITQAVSLSGSGYVTSPFGQQNVITRTGPKGRTIVQTVVPLKGDHGLSSTVSATLSDALDLSFWYWRSATYHANTATVSVVVHLGELFRKP